MHIVNLLIPVMNKQTNKYFIIVLLLCIYSFLISDHFFHVAEIINIFDLSGFLYLAMNEYEHLPICT